MTREYAKQILGKHHFAFASMPDEVVEAVHYLMYGEQGPTNKNDLAQERYQDLIEYFGDEKVAKTILESRKEFKAWLERLKWNVKRADELARELEQIKPTNKNDLEFDCCISKEQTIQRVLTYFDCIDKGCDDEWVKGYEAGEEDAISVIKSMPSVTPQEPTDNDVVLTYDVYHDLIADRAEKLEQEPILDKIYADIQRLRGCSCSCSDGIIDDVEDILDKYKAESDPQESEDKE